MRSSAVPVLVAGVLTAACAQHAAPLPQPCPGQDIVYSHPDTLSGVRNPKPRFTPPIRFSEPGTGAMEVTVIVEPDGRATIESVRTTGDHGQREQAELRQGLTQWRFVPATLNGCGVRFRTSLRFTTVTH